MKRIYIIPIMLLLSAWMPPRLVKTKLPQGVTVSLPPELKPMTEDDISQRFPSVRAPIGAFTNQDRLVDFSANISATQWPDKNLEVAKKFFKAGIYNLYDKIEMISEGVYEVHKKKYIYFEFESRVNGGKFNDGDQNSLLRYTFIQYFVEPGRAMVFSFHCPHDEQEQWQPVAREVMKSITIK